MSCETCRSQGIESTAIKFPQNIHYFTQNNCPIDIFYHSKGNLKKKKEATQDVRLGTGTVLLVKLFFTFSERQTLQKWTN